MFVIFPQTFRYEDSSSSEMSAVNTEDDREGGMSAPAKCNNKRAANKLQSSHDLFSSALCSTPGTYQKLQLGFLLNTNKPFDCSIHMQENLQLSLCFCDILDSFIYVFAMSLFMVKVL